MVEFVPNVIKISNFIITPVLLPVLQDLIQLILLVNPALKIVKNVTKMDALSVRLVFYFTIKIAL